MENNKIEKLKKIVLDSIISIYKNDKQLIEIGGMERAINFYLALYLRDAIKNISWLKNLNIDLEYNKNGTEQKKILGYQNGVRPDIIIHSRGDNKKIF